MDFFFLSVCFDVWWRGRKEGRKKRHLEMQGTYFIAGMMRVSLCFKKSCIPGSGNPEPLVLVLLPSGLPCNITSGKVFRQTTSKCAKYETFFQVQPTLNVRVVAKITAAHMIIEPAYICAYRYLPPPSRSIRAPTIIDGAQKANDAVNGKKIMPILEVITSRAGKCRRNHALYVGRDQTIGNCEKPEASHRFDGDLYIS